MARSRLTDYLQQYSFWLMDVGPLETLALPIFLPLLGFETISSPEIRLETVNIPEANWPLTKKVIKHGNVAPITLTRGALFYDADFYRWIATALSGDTSGFEISGFPLLQIGGVTYRRNMVLMQFFPRNLIAGSSVIAATVALGAGAMIGGEISLVASAGTILAGAAGMSAGGPFEFAQRVPAKAWWLQGCIPIRYKPGDFDAKSSQVQISELEMEIDQVEEISLAS